jgi:hypothetical protein
MIIPFLISGWLLLMYIIKLNKIIHHYRTLYKHDDIYVPNLQEIKQKNLINQIPAWINSIKKDKQEILKLNTREEYV